MKTTALRAILGKTVAAAIVSDGNTSGPPSQLFLVFDDGTALEVYGNLQIAGNLGAGGLEHIQHYAQLSGGSLTVVKRDM
jgi:hypothetical protein